MDTENIIPDKNLLDQYSQLMFANLRKSLLQDLVNNRKESALFTKYPIEKVVAMLESPYKNEKTLRTMSRFLYCTSSHYYRLVNYYATLPVFNYIVTPATLPKKINKKTYKDTYTKIIYQLEKYNLKCEIPKIMAITLLEGIFYGLEYETSDAYYILPFNSNYAEISSTEDGTYVFSIDLNYFTTDRLYLLDSYGEEIKNAYYRYRGNKELNIKGNTKLRWFEPSNGICIKADETDMLYSIPIFSSTFLDILRLDDYKLLKKAKKTLDNYKVLAMKIDCDENGAPKMDFDIAKKYYNQAASNIPSGIGLIMSPFNINDFTFQSSSTAESNAVNEAENDFWAGTGTSGMIFGSTKASSSSSLGMSVKADEQLAFKIMHQIGRCFNKKIKLMGLSYLFKLKFLDQSIFNEDEMCNKFQKAAQYGVSGSKLLYAASLGMSPSDVVNLSYLENDILDVTGSMFTSPLISSNTLSPDSSDGGAPTIEEQGGKPTDNTEASREQNGNNEN